MYKRQLAALTVGYALSPIDLIPDFIPVLGYLDDLLLLPALVALTVRCIPADVWARSRERSVSYTHLDVYKRQVCLPADDLPQGAVHQDGGGGELPEKGGCLLYTSRCV